MDFGRILDAWDEDKPARSKRKTNSSWLDAYPPDEHARKKAELDDLTDSGAGHPRSVRLMSPQRTLDLHGFRAVEAISSLDEFLATALRDGLEKVLVIHGKGKHSSGNGGVLRELVYDHLRAHPLAGEMGVPHRNLGGSGAVWVALRRRG